MQNLGWLVTERLFRLALSVAVGFAVARYLGPASFGQLAYALAVVAIGAAIAEGGVAAIVRRDVAGGVADGTALLRSAMKLRLLLGTGCYVALVAWALLGETGEPERWLLVLLGGMFFQPALAVPELWLQGKLQARLSTQAQLIALVVGASLRIALVVMRGPLLAFAAVSVLEAGVGVVLLRYYARAARNANDVAPAPDGALAALWAQSWPLLLSGLTVMIYIRIDLVMIRHLADEVAAGTYAAAVRLSELWFFLPPAIVSSLLPSLLRARAAGPTPYRVALQRLMDVNTAAAYALAVPTVSLAPWIVRLAYGPSYAAAGPILAVHGWTLFWVGLGVARGQFCVNEGLTRLHLVATTAGAALNIGLNWVLIPRYGPIGAAWATFAAQATAAWLSSFCFAATRGCAELQTRALLIPFRWLPYVRRSVP